VPIPPSPCPFRARRRSHPERGFTLIELLVVLAIAGALLTVGLPPLIDLSARLRLNLAADEMVGVLRRTRMRAVRDNAHVAVRFTEDEGRIVWAVYADGDGDGVRTRDIRRGVDPRLAAPRPLRRFDGSVWPGFPAGALPHDPSNPHRRLHRRDDPLRFGRSDLVSFGPLGTSTSGTLYLTTGERWTAAVRVYGASGKVRVLIHDADSGSWR